MNKFFTTASSDHNFGKWVEGDVRVLFLTGLSGSGKTTAADELGDLLDAKVVHLDQYLRPLIRSKVGDNPDYEKVYFEQGVKLLLEDNPEGKIVIEGCHITWFNINELKEHAVLCMNVSLYLSCYRALRRALSLTSLKEYGIKGIFKPLMFNLKQYKRVQTFSQTVC